MNEQTLDLFLKHYGGAEAMAERVNTALDNETFDTDTDIQLQSSILTLHWLQKQYACTLDAMTLDTTGKVKAGLYALVNQPGYFNWYWLGDANPQHVEGIIKDLGLNDLYIHVDTDDSGECTMCLMSYPYDEDNEPDDDDDPRYTKEEWERMINLTKDWRIFFDKDRQS